MCSIPFLNKPLAVLLGKAVWCGITSAVLLSVATVNGHAFQTTTDNAAHIAQAQTLLQDKNLKGARDLFETVLAAQPSNTAAQTGEIEASEQLALQARAAGDKDAALRDLLHARSIVPENAHLLYDLGVLEDEMHLNYDADESLAHAYTLHPGDPITLYAIARVKLDLDQLTQAEASMRKYLEMEPNDASAYFGLGRILQRAQRPEEAEHAFSRSIQLRPDQTESYFQLGELSLQTGKYDDAISWYAKVLIRNPNHGGAIAGTGIAYFRQKNYEKARAFLEHAVAAAPDYAAAHYYYALTLDRLGRKEDSRREFDLSTKIDADERRASNQRMRITPQQ